MIRAELIERLESAHFGQDDASLLQEIARQYSLSHLAFVALDVPTEKQASRPLLLLTYPEEWQKRYFAQKYIDFDPAIYSALHSIIPTDWATINRKSPAVRQLFGEAKEHGIGDQGITIPVRGPRGELALLAASGTFTDADWKDFKRQSMPDLTVLTCYIYQKIVEKHANASMQLELSKREIECLKWAANGKTIDDISDILSISARTVRCYLDSARHKLNCLNLHHATAKAVSLRIIPPVL